MSARKREPRAITLAEIEQTFELASYWFGEKWCPAVHRNSNGYGIRIVRSYTVSGDNQQVSYDYFELDTEGTVTIAPRGFAKDFKPGHVVDIEAAAIMFAEPIPGATRIGW